MESTADLTSLTFEEAVKRLEAVVEAMEDEETDLETAVALYKDGQKLSKHCNELLSRFETEVEVLKREDIDYA